VQGNGIQQTALNAMLQGSGNVTPGSNPYLDQKTQVGTNPYAGSNTYL
jgi:hypothetical protein